MARIFRKDAKIPCEIDDCTFQLSPLNIHQKNQITALLAQAAKAGQNESSMIDAVGPMLEASRLAIKFSVKGVTGIEDENGDPYELAFDSNGVADECLEDLSNFELSDKLITCCIALVKGVPTEIVGQDGKPLEGVRFNKVPLKKASRKAAQG